MAEPIPPEPTPSTINTNTTLFTALLYDVTNITILKNPVSPNESTEARIVYVKGTGNISTLEGSYLRMNCPTGVQFYPNFNFRFVYPYWCATLQQYPTNTYNLFNIYTDSIAYGYENPAPASVAVNVPANNSFLFVDLQSQSKSLVLPTLNSLQANTSSSPYFVIKDVYGSANTNNLFISTSGVNETFEGRSNSLKLSTNYACVELAGDINLNRWHILNFFNGSL